MPNPVTSPKIRVAFIGAGQFANAFHYSTLSRMEDVEMAAIAELDEERMAKTGDKYGIDARYTDYREMIDKEQPDVVYVVMRPHLVKGIALDVIRTGTHVATEKPAGMNTAEVRALAEAAAEHDINSMVGTNRRYCAVIRKARELVTERGPVSTVFAEFHKHLKQEMFGMSILYADVLHVLDPLRFFCGEVESVQAHADHWYTKEGWENSNNVYQALIRFQGGASGIFSANRQAGGRYERFEVHGDGITAVVRAPDRVEVIRSGEKEAEIITGKDLTGSDDMLDTYGYFDENRTFMDCLRSGEHAPTHLGDNLKLMELCDRIEGGDHREMLRR